MMSGLLAKGLLHSALLRKIEFLCDNRSGDTKIAIVRASLTFQRP
jgi:hypothetical protein